ncbi:MAG: RagB/SusD family nutrient uptake outer membrane protein [Chitinophagaceae bacterium]|nr:MAG: RagB/SusD family nutrient uptake outer membrane protein [Chitinophagaceae bacterium]
MKIKNILLGIGITAITLSSCSKSLELKDPQGLDPQSALSTDQNIKKVLQGAYDALSSTTLYGGDIQLMSELLGSDGELTWVGTFNNYREVWGKSIITTNTLVAGTWANAYSAINIANNVLDSVGGVIEDDRDRVKGEALFIRAAMHFELVRLYAKDYSAATPSSSPGVPVMTAPTNSLPEVTSPARNTVAEVYAAVIADLTEAEALLPNENTVYATKTAAAAMLSRVYFQQRDYEGARQAATRGIDEATGKDLLPTVMANFNISANTNETIFAIQVSDQDGTNGLQTYYSVDIFGGRDGDIEVNDKHMDLYQAGDLRASSTTNPNAAAQFTFNTAFFTKYGAFRTTKWRDLYKNVIVIRLAELYLTRAESNLRLGGAPVGATPLSDINQVHSTQRTGLAPFVAVTADQVAIERRRELAFEGFSIHDARRTNRNIDNLSPNENKFVLPIPFREINANKNLVQNDGYK